MSSLTHLSKLIANKLNTNNSTSLVDERGTEKVVSSVGVKIEGLIGKADIGSLTVHQLSITLQEKYASVQRLIDPTKVNGVSINYADPVTLSLDGKNPTSLFTSDFRNFSVAMGTNIVLGLSIDGGANLLENIVLVINSYGIINPSSIESVIFEGLKFLVTTGEETTSNIWTSSFQFRTAGDDIFTPNQGNLIIDQYTGYGFYYDLTTRPSYIVATPQDLYATGIVYIGDFLKDASLSGGGGGTAIPSPLTYRGAWFAYISLTAFVGDMHSYMSGELVTYTDGYTDSTYDLKTYVCQQEYEPGTKEFIQSSDTFTFMGVWDSTVIYNPDETVTFFDVTHKLYKCDTLTVVTESPSTAPAKWTEEIGALWDPLEVYFRGQTVIIDTGIIKHFKCIETIIAGESPLTTATKWNEITSSTLYRRVPSGAPTTTTYTFKRGWDNTLSYSQHDIIAFEKKVYFSVGVTTINEDPTSVAGLTEWTEILNELGTETGSLLEDYGIIPIYNDGVHWIASSTEAGAIGLPESNITNAMVAGDSKLETAYPTAASGPLASQPYSDLAVFGFTDLTLVGTAVQKLEHILIKLLPDLPQKISTIIISLDFSLVDKHVSTSGSILKSKDTGIFSDTLAEKIVNEFDKVTILGPTAAFFKGVGDELVVEFLADGSVHGITKETLSLTNSDQSGPFGSNFYKIHSDVADSAGIFRALQIDADTNFVDHASGTTWTGAIVTAANAYVAATKRFSCPTNVAASINITNKYVFDNSTVPPTLGADNKISDISAATTLTDWTQVSGISYLNPDVILTGQYDVSGVASWWVCSDCVISDHLNFKDANSSSSSYNAFNYKDPAVTDVHPTTMSDITTLSITGGGSDNMLQLKENQFAELDIPGSEPSIFIKNIYNETATGTLEFLPPILGGFIINTISMFSDGGAWKSIEEKANIGAKVNKRVKLSSLSVVLTASTAILPTGTGCIGLPNVSDGLGNVWDVTKDISLDVDAQCFNGGYLSLRKKNYDVDFYSVGVTNPDYSASTVQLYTKTWAGSWATTTQINYRAVCFEVEYTAVNIQGLIVSFTSTIPNVTAVTLNTDDSTGHLDQDVLLYYKIISGTTSTLVSISESIWFDGGRTWTAGNPYSFDLSSYASEDGNYGGYDSGGSKTARKIKLVSGAPTIKDAKIELMFLINNDKFNGTVPAMSNLQVETY